MHCFGRSGLGHKSALLAVIEVRTAREIGVTAETPGVLELMVLPEEPVETGHDIQMIV